MKILLVTPPPYKQGENSRFLEREPTQTYSMPLGLGYIASTLEQAGHDVSIIDGYAQNLSPHALIENIRKLEPTIIGIQCFSDQRASWFRLIEEIRAFRKDVKIVLGGPHPSLMPEQVLIRFQPDAIVIGEGEKTMLDLVETWGKNGNLARVKGIAYLEAGKVIITEPRERIKDLDVLPFPAHHLVNLSDYSGWDFMKNLYPLFGLQKPPMYATISTSRGCVGNCGYCSAPLIWKRKWTKRSATNVVNEMEMLVREYGVEFIILTDDIFSINQKRVLDICQEILRRDLHILWGFETAVNYVSSELLHMAKKAGCRCILYGVESGSKTILSTISKTIEEKDVVSAFTMTKDAGIVAGAFLMVGNPGENEKTINETIHLLRKINPDIILPQIAMITPSTKIFSIAQEKGCIDENYWLTDLPFPYYTCERGLKTLLRWHRKLLYYRHSDLAIFLRTIRDYIELHTGIRLSRHGITRCEIPPD
jgi:radical SAM superfamily enzyme YgiQ (UPF0313 family)